jgi:hypothetical protein
VSCRESCKTSTDDNGLLGREAAGSSCWCAHFASM